jgi:hypothetical protein
VSPRRGSRIISRPPSAYPFSAQARLGPHSANLWSRLTALHRRGDSVVFQAKLRRTCARRFVVRIPWCGIAQDRVSGSFHSPLLPLVVRTRSGRQGLRVFKNSTRTEIAALFGSLWIGISFGGRHFGYPLEQRSSSLACLPQHPKPRVSGIPYAPGIACNRLGTAGRGGKIFLCVWIFIDRGTKRVSVAAAQSSARRRGRLRSKIFSSDE